MIITGAVGLAIGAVLWIIQGDALGDSIARTAARLVAFLTERISENTPARVFLPLMLALPLVGVPLSFFLLVLGIKFGLGFGLLILEIMLPAHMLIAYFLAKGIRAPIETYLIRRKNIQIPEIPETKALMFSFLVTTFPMFPYAIKLYLLPLAGVRFRYCFWVNWAVQGTLCIPFVLLGRSAAEMNVPLLATAVVAIVVIFFLLRWAGRRYTAVQNAKNS